VNCKGNDGGEGVRRRRGISGYGLCIGTTRCMGLAHMRAAFR